MWPSKWLLPNTPATLNSVSVLWEFLTHTTSDMYPARESLSNCDFWYLLSPSKILIWHHYTTLHTTVLPLLIFAKSHLWVWISYRGLECNCVWLEKTDSQRIYVSLQRSWVPFVRHVRILKISNILHAYEIFYKLGYVHLLALREFCITGVFIFTNLINKIKLLDLCHFNP